MHVRHTQTKLATTSRQATHRSCLTISSIMRSSLKLTEIVSKKWGGGGGGKVASPSAAACPRGHFAAYTREGRRFFIPIAYLDSDTFRELFSMAEEEFGEPRDRPIVLPCSADRLEQILDAFRSGAGGGAKKKSAGRISKIW